MEKRDKIIVALDFDDQGKALEIVNKLKGKLNFFKIGSHLFTKYGPSIVKEVVSLGGEVFLDLKFHDIPNTVEGASKSACSLGVKIFNVHASGGKRMMDAAAKAAGAFKNRPLVLAVTVLTSMSDDDLGECGIRENVNEHVVKLAILAKQSGLDGVVASAHEIELIKAECGKDFVVLSPGIRPVWSDKDDQKRIVTPREAFEKGANYIVIGRAITKASDPVKAADRILEEF